MKRKVGIAVLTGVLALGGTTVGAYAVQSDKASNIQGKDKSVAEVTLSTEEAKQIAKKQLSGNIEQVELERENGRLVYKVEFEKYGDDDDVYVDAQTGKILSNSDIRPAHDTVKISKAQAKEIALRQVKGTVTEIDLDRDDREPVYEVEIATANGHEANVDVSATTGQIVRVEWDD
ncbi:PepSY domain-containing protein [Aneurinibacillus migulanus]|uniref:PepSY domain-containing protein n=1 Tax=Aneurinibacillus migulanus TaxID=47500 RepID=UPI002E1E92F3|nr:PepSY domain-containing protein [Aneurinibacillus migulanus]